MGIKFRCPECEKKLHVKAFLAGKRGICPHCGGKVRIPLASTATRAAVSSSKQASPPAEAADRASAARGSHSDAEVAAPASENPHRSGVHQSTADPIAEAPDAVWYVRPPSGGEYGPANGALMRHWLGEGRVSQQALVWREGWTDWQSASTVFPAPTPSPSAPTAENDDLPVALGESPTAVDRPAPSAAGSSRRKRRAPPHARGRNIALIIVLAILCIVLLIALSYVLYTQS